MTAVKIRRPEVEETPLSREEMLVALREGHAAMGLADSIIIVAPKVQRVLHLEIGRRAAALSSAASEGAQP